MHACFQSVCVCVCVCVFCFGLVFLFFAISRKKTQMQQKTYAPQKNRTLTQFEWRHNQQAIQTIQKLYHRSIMTQLYIHFIYLFIFWFCFFQICLLKNRKHQKISNKKKNTNKRKTNKPSIKVESLFEAPNSFNNATTATGSVALT